MTDRKWSRLSDKLVGVLARKRPEFQSRRTHGSVRIDMDGSTVGYVDVALASGSAGMSFRSKRQWGGQALQVVYAKDDQVDRKRVAYVCAFLCFLVADDRPSEERQKTPVLGITDPKTWFSKFSKDRWSGEDEAARLEKEVTSACRSLIDVFHDVKEAVRSARREDVSEAVARVTQDLPFLASQMTEEEWVQLYRQAVVDGVHKL